MSISDGPISGSPISAPFHISAVETVILPGVGTIVLSGLSPTLAVDIRPGAGSILLVGLSPSPVIPPFLDPAAGTITITGFDPAVGTITFTATGVGSIVLTGYTPTLSLLRAVSLKIRRFPVDNQRVFLAGFTSEEAL